MVSYEWEFSSKLLEIRGKKPGTFTRGSRTKRAMKDSVEFQPKLDICFSLACPWNLISWDSKMWKKGHTKWSINELTAFLDGRPVSFISLPFHNKLSRWTDCKSTRSSQLKIPAFHQFKTQKFNNKKVLCSCRSNYKNSAQQGLPTLR